MGACPVCRVHARQSVQRALPLSRPRPCCPSQLEKYRPHVLKDVVGNEEAVARLQIIAAEGNMPNLILAVSAQPQQAQQGQI